MVCRVLSFSRSGHRPGHGGVTSGVRMTPSIAYAMDFALAMCMYTSQAVMATKSLARKRRQSWAWGSYGCMARFKHVMRRENGRELTGLPLNT